MRLNENYTFEGAADWCGQDLASVRCVSSLQNWPGTGFQKVSVGVGKRESLALSVTLKLEPVRRCLDALEELEPLAMYEEDPPL
ncbi:hypothetical protein TNCV_4558251 [Trichonephila clavipes]|nr:hypothetical protein TNCV_4558251 [Trichonephila clavipes]